MFRQCATPSRARIQFLSLKRKYQFDFHPDAPFPHAFVIMPIRIRILAFDIVWHINQMENIIQNMRPMCFAFDVVVHQVQHQRIAKHAQQRVILFNMCSQVMFLRSSRMSSRLIANVDVVRTSPWPESVEQLGARFAGADRPPGLQARDRVASSV